MRGEGGGEGEGDRRGLHYIATVEDLPVCVCVFACVCMFVCVCVYVRIHESAP